MKALVNFFMDRSNIAIVMVLYSAFVWSHVYQGWCNLVTNKFYPESYSR
jgi:hypothetical protein